jgi:AcrR family transcriptional regulator
LKDAIVVAATRVLLREGLQGWSVDRVAAEAGCAKGLVHYHHGTKRALLGRVGEALGRARQARRLDALDGSGADALDRLWLSLVREVRSGEWAAWAAIAAEPGIPGPMSPPGELPALANAIGRALDLAAPRAEDVRLAAAALDGFQLALHLGTAEESVREAYHRLCLTFLP